MPFVTISGKKVDVGFIKDMTTDQLMMLSLIDRLSAISGALQSIAANFNNVLATDGLDEIGYPKLRTTQEND